MKTLEKARFDTRLTKEQKEFFEYAANVGGFRTLTEFVIFSVQQQANRIVDAKNTVLASKKDQEIFFDAIMHPAKPNSNLSNAAARFKKVIEKR